MEVGQQQPKPLVRRGFFTLVIILSSSGMDHLGFQGSLAAEQAAQRIDGSGLAAIVTGASSGIGTETARVLALRGVHVVMAIRNMVAGKEVQAILKQNPSAKVDAMKLDVSSIASVNSFVSGFKLSGLPLNILINNAGILATPDMLSKDNIELQFATNHAITNLLLETMKKTAQESIKGGRILNVSSRRHQGAATTCYAALHPQVEGVSGKYFSDSNLAEASSQANDAQLAKRLWDFTATLIEENYPHSYEDR